MSESEDASPEDEIQDWDEEEHFAAVGRVASEWAHLEMAVDLKALRLAGIPWGPGICLTAQVSGIARKFNAFMAIAEHLGSQKYKKRLTKLMENLRHLGERRNRVIHDPWSFNQEGPYRAEFTANRKLVVQFVPADVNDIDKLVGDIGAAWDELHALDGLIAAEIASLPKTPPEASPEPPLGQHPQDQPNG